MKTIAEMEAEKARAREIYRSLTHWTGTGLVYKRCCNCHYMPTNPERDRCARMDKQVREPGWNWNCPGWEWGFNVHQEAVAVEPARTMDGDTEPSSGFAKIIEPIAELLERKNTDYGGSYSLLRGKFGPMAFLIRIHDKLNRAEQLYTNEARVADEGLIDTLQDIIGYAVLEIQYLSRDK